MSIFIPNSTTNIHWNIQLKGIPFVFRSVYNEDNPCALNAYLLDEDCVHLMKHCYKPCTKEDLYNSDDIMINFFGSAEYGKDVLSKVTEEHWTSME